MLQAASTSTVPCLMCARVNLNSFMWYKYFEYYTLNNYCEFYCLSCQFIRPKEDSKTDTQNPRA
jgi:hypothetical protein